MNLSLNWLRAVSYTHLDVYKRQALACLTQPIALLSFYPLSLYLVLFANAATYALAGLTVEILRRQLKPAN